MNVFRGYWWPVYIYKLNKMTGISEDGLMSNRLPWIREVKDKNYWLNSYILWQQYSDWVPFLLTWFNFNPGMDK